jgi:hypothetical protein
MRRFFRVSFCVAVVNFRLQHVLLALFPACVSSASMFLFSVILRLVCPSVLVFSRVSAPGVVALRMLFAKVLAVGSAFFL